MNDPRRGSPPPRGGASGAGSPTGPAPYIPRGNGGVLELGDRLPRITNADEGARSSST